ncbi:hypothetical protein 65p415 [Aeromonas phage 65]|uniref:Uncharacterized protein n=2 Tax=Ishigurovirus osborne TaxID=260149 RepID=A0A219YCQ5_9CAUD|nr:hypothetical protein ST65p415 [Aeromonas phage 65]ADQ53422.1 hypothetical protein 65p415 [Aeromonas phage 65]APU01779.1 hypothetical protein [Aeromonas phage 65.2]
MQEIHNYLGMKAKAEKYAIEVILFNDRIKLKNRKDVIIGVFLNATDAYNYLLGYESGIMDSSLYPNIKV